MIADAKLPHDRKKTTELQGVRCVLSICVHHGVSIRSEGHAHGGEPGRGHPCQDVQPSRCVGMASVRQESLPIRTPLQGGEAPRAVPDSRGTLPARPGAGRGSSRAPGVNPCGRGDPVAGADRCRRNEVLGLRWEDLDFKAGEMRLADSKTGARVVPLLRASGRNRSRSGCGGLQPPRPTFDRDPGLIRHNLLICLKIIG